MPVFHKSNALTYGMLSKRSNPTPASVVSPLLRGLVKMLICQFTDGLLKDKSYNVCASFVITLKSVFRFS
jgi:hypothetical protein